MAQSRWARYTSEFKAEAVRLVRTSSDSLTKVARDLGVNAETLRLWVRGAQSESRVPLTDDERSELRRLRREVRTLRMERDILKKATAFFAKRVSFAFIEVERATFPVRVLCRVLAVAPSGYYAWRSRRPSARAIRDGQLARQLRVIHAEHRRAYGRPRLHRALRAAGVRVGEKRVRRLMRAVGLEAHGRRRFRVTTARAPRQPVTPNLLGRAFRVAIPKSRLGR